MIHNLCPHNGCTLLATAEFDQEKHEVLNMKTLSRMYLNTSCVYLASTKSQRLIINSELSIKKKHEFGKT